MPSAHLVSGGFLSIRYHTHQCGPPLQFSPQLQSVSVSNKYNAPQCLLVIYWLYGWALATRADGHLLYDIQAAPQKNIPYWKIPKYFYHRNIYTTPVDPPQVRPQHMPSRLPIGRSGSQTSAPEPLGVAHYG